MQSMHGNEMLRIALHVHKRRKKGPTVVDRRRRGLIFRKGPEYYFAHNFKECKKGGKTNVAKCTAHYQSKY